MDKKKILGIGVVVAAIILVVVLQKPNSTNPPENGSQDKVFDPKNPNFIIGDVIQIQDYDILFNSSGNTYKAKVSVETKLVRQVPDASAGIKLVGTVLSEFKPKDMIVVYFSSPPENNTYIAEKIQIISQ